MSISDLLIQWYRRYRRDLPWRRTRDAYAIWVSEIILQQTHVDQGLPYYHRFLQAFPDAASLARANLQEVLRLWQGLGYYSRARNMHQAAREVMEIHDGKMPDSYAELRLLKGVGEYTAAAVASMASSEAVPVIDGNVIRVLSRLYGIGQDPSSAQVRRELRNTMQQLMQGQDPGELNQAVMEFGALQCVPRSPDCIKCPLNLYCMARKEDRVQELPFRRPLSPPRHRYLNYVVIRNISRPDNLFLIQRLEKDIWRGLWTFPCIEDGKLLDNTQLIAHPDASALLTDCANHTLTESIDLIHVLSHQRLHCRFFTLTCKPEGIPTPLPPKYGQVFPLSQLPPMPRLMHRFLEMTTVT
ncbi:MAG: A/G-specific adenine glycosylase [Bacteroidales bacterium]|nr:A/G-specific adenine glycosylase [Bacteroidales bacterium]